MFIIASRKDQHGVIRLDLHYIEYAPKKDKSDVASNIYKCECRIVSTNEWNQYTRTMSFIENVIQSEIDGLKCGSKFHGS